MSEAQGGAGGGQNSFDILDFSAQVDSTAPKEESTGQYPYSPFDSNTEEAGFEEANTDISETQAVEKKALMSDESISPKSQEIVDEEQEEQEEKVVEEEEEVHTVQTVVTIVAAFPVDGGGERNSDNPVTIVDVKQRATESPKPLNFYKFEYQLIPDDPDTLVTCDLVVYKVASKLFSEKFEPKILKSWESENKLWVTWSQIHKLRLTKSKLLKLFDHELVLKIWNTKDYCAARTRFDKPKPFKFPKTVEYSEEHVRLNIFDVCNLYLKQMPYQLHEKLRKLPNQFTVPTPNKEKVQGDTTNTLIVVPARSVMSYNIGNKLSELATDHEMVRNAKTLKLDKIKRRNLSKMSSIKSSPNLLHPESKHSKVGTNGTGLANLTGGGGAGGGAAGGTMASKTKKESIAQQEYLKKNGVVQIRLKMKELFADAQTSLFGRIDEPLNNIHDCLYSVTLMSPLMSERQLYELNPLTIKLEKLTDMPNHPHSYAELRDKCERAYCSYDFFQQAHYKSKPSPQEKNIYVNDTNVYLAGLFNKEELNEYLQSSLFEIRVHDRNRRSSDEPATEASLFGNSADDAHISNVNSVAAKHTLHNPFETRKRQWDPYGMARINLYDLVLGKRLVEFFVPVLPCHAPDALGRSTANFNSKASASSSSAAALASTNTLTTHTTTHTVTVNTKRIGSEDVPMTSGAFLESNTHLSVKIASAKPLLEVRNPYQSTANLPKTKICVFGRTVIRIACKRFALIKSVCEHVREINAHALNLDKHPVNVQEAALSTYELSEEEQQSRKLNIVTGFHLIDSEFQLLVLEGLKDRAIRDIVERIPRERDDTEVQCLFNSTLSFSKRLYASLNVEILKIKLFEPLGDITRKPLLYVRDMTPKSSYEALVKLYQLIVEPNLRNAVRSELLPDASMIMSMSKEFGVPLTEHDLEPFKSSASPSSSSSSSSSSNDIDADAAIEKATGSEQRPATAKTHPLTPALAHRVSAAEMANGAALAGKRKSLKSDEPVNQDSDREQYMYKVPHTSRVWTPIDHFNEQYLQEKRHRELTRHAIDHPQINKESLKELIEKNKHKKPSKTYMLADGTFNYSTQAMNSTESTLNQFRAYINANTPKQLYTYNQAYEHSGTFVPVNLRAHEVDERRASVDKWQSKEGWIFPEIKRSLQDNEHPRRLDQASIDKLNEQWVENYLHANKLRPTLERTFYEHARQRDDFDVWSKARPQDIFPVTIFESLDRREAFEKELSAEEREVWKAKLAVDNPEVKTHRLLPSTELHPTRSNQLDKLVGLLKDRPIKPILMYKGVNFNDVPALDVNKENAYVDHLAKASFMPGDSFDRHITDDANRIARRDDERKTFEKINGKDFDFITQPKRPFTHKKTYEAERPLTGAFYV